MTTYGGSARGGGQRRWNSYNHIGNVVGISNASGYFVEAVNTDAFGNPLASTQTGEWASGLGGNRGLTTKELDPAAGMYYFYQRWYDPQTATFASRAPMPKELEHAYSLTTNNPIRDADPRGEWIFNPFTLRRCAWRIHDDVAAEYRADRSVDGQDTDKFMHCLVMCRIAQECCNSNPKCTGILLAWVNASDDDRGDQVANAWGASYGLCPGRGCEKACAKRYPAYHRREGH